MSEPACKERLRPSKLNGYVTTPTVRYPASFEIWATTGAAPEPVPPPMPAVIKTISESLRQFAMVSFDSSAACSPRRGFPPVPGFQEMN